MRALLALAALVLLLAPGAVPGVPEGGPAPGLRLVTVGASPWWLDVDPVRHLAYVAATGSGELVVLDGLAERVAARVPLAGPAGVAVDAARQRVHVAQGDGHLAVLDAVRLEVLGRVPVGAAPRPPAVDPVTGRVYVPDAASATVTVVDGLTAEAIGTFAVPPGPYDAAVDAAARRLVVSHGCRSTVSVHDLAGAAPAVEIPVGACAGAVAVGPSPGQAAVLAYPGLVLVDTTLGTRVGAAFAGYRASDVVVDPRAAVAYVTASDWPDWFGMRNHLFAVALAPVEPIGDVGDLGSWVPGPLAFDPILGHAYASNPWSGTVAVADPCADLLLPERCVLPHLGPHPLP